MNDTGVTNQIDYMSAQEKAAKVTFQIVSGDTPTTADIAERFGMTWQGAYRMMSNVSRVVPLTTENGRWRVWDTFD